MPITRLSISARTAAHVALFAAAAILLAGCSAFSGGGGNGAAPLPAGLSAQMNQQGAQLDRAAALGLINAYRTTTGAPALSADPALDAQAQTLANTYASTGQAPSAPGGIRALKLSAGYSSFAETFSGWRNSSQDARALTDAGARRAGLAVSYDPNSAYGTHWVLLLDD